MNVSLTPELEKLVAAKVASGLYGSASEVVREALRLLAEQDKVRKLRRTQLKREISKGLESARKDPLIDGHLFASEMRARLAARKRGHRA